MDIKLRKTEHRTITESDIGSNNQEHSHWWGGGGGGLNAFIGTFALDSAVVEKQKKCYARMVAS